MNYSAIKSGAKAAIAGKILILFLITLIISIISGIASGILSLIPVVGSLIASIVITPAFALSTTRIYLSLFNGRQPQIGDAFSGFDDFFSAFKVSFLTGLFTLLWSLLFVIPGIIKSISYSMSMYILAENKGKPALECIRESQQMTKGHKMQLFILGLSFIGWFLLCCITFGIAIIWVGPYIYATFANAYLTLKPAAPSRASGVEFTARQEEPAAPTSTGSTSGGNNLNNLKNL
jgi:uncharacterized membrane protein